MSAGIDTVSMPGTISLCKNPHQGLCTVDCPYRDSCPKDRVPFLIPAIVIHYRRGKIYPDDYINDIALRRQELLSGASHQGEPRSDAEYKNKIAVHVI